MDIKSIEWIIDKSLGITGLAIITYFLRYFFSSINQRITDTQANNDLRFSEINARLASIEGKYRDVLDIILEKFSKWEDRILKTLSKIGNLSEEQFKKEIQELRTMTQEDLKTMRLKLERFSLEVAQIVIEPPSGSEQRILDLKFDEFKNETSSRINELESASKKLIKFVITLNDKQKEHEFKLSNIIAMSKKY